MYAEVEVQRRKEIKTNEMQTEKQAMQEGGDNKKDTKNDGKQMKLVAFNNWIIV